MGLLGNPRKGQEFEDGEDKQPLSEILGEDCENGLLVLGEGLAMGLRGEGGEVIQR